MENPYIAQQRFQEHGEFLDKVVPKSVRYHAGKMRHDLAYELQVNSVTDINQIAEIHKAEKKMHLQSNKMNRHSIFDKDHWNEYLYKRFELGQLWIYSLVDISNQNIISYMLGTLHRDTFYMGNMAFNPVYKKYGSGQIILYEILKYNNHNHDWLFMDLGSGRYQWKFEWTPDFNLLYHFNIFKMSNIKVKIYKRLKVMKEIKKLFLENGFNLL